jgi:hypothetical protein
MTGAVLDTATSPPNSVSRSPDALRDTGEGKGLGIL